ncbi:sensor histidine kinase [Acinetobacter brisouii]
MKVWQSLSQVWQKRRIGVDVAETSLQQQLLAAQFEVILLRLMLNIARVEQPNEQLPELLHDLQQQLDSTFAMQHVPKLCFVLCYPFTQECFIYHAQSTQLERQDLNQIQSVLLNQTYYAQSQVENLLQIQNHQARLLLLGQEMVVWRLYVQQTNVIESNLQPHLQQLDDALQQGFQYWIEQQQKRQAILLKERREFAAELHDSIAQVLGFLRLKSAQLHSLCKNQPSYSALLPLSEDLASYTHYAYQQTRELITASRLAYQELDFASALKKVMDEFAHQSSISFELDNRVAHLNVSAKYAMQLLYIIRESLSNVVRHSHASSAQVRIEYLASGALQICICDNGRGIQLKNKRSDSFGLEIMQERAERIGAELRFVANSPQGTCVILYLEQH